jgi:hypothetical protein
MGLQRSDVLALIALLISLVALFTTVLQVLQQYFSSAEGYRRCAESVMGKVRTLTPFCYPMNLLLGVVTC